MVQKQNSSVALYFKLVYKILYLCTTFTIIINSFHYSFTGYWYLSTSSEIDKKYSLTSTINNSTISRQAFVRGQKLPPDDNVILVTLLRLIAYYLLFLFAFRLVPAPYLI